MGFLGILHKSDSGLKPIVQRTPTPLGPSSTSGYLVQPKAVARAPVPGPKGEPVAPAVPSALPPAPPATKPEPSPATPPVPRIAIPRAAPETPASVPVVARPVLPSSPPPPPQVTWGGVRRADDLAYLRRGVVLQARGEHALAIEAFTKAIAADARCIEAYASRGISREALGDLEGARADYAKSIEVEVKEGIARALARS